jgi:hypothetical protein
MCRVNLVDFLIACYQPASASVVSLHGRARADSHDRHRSNLRQEMHLKRSLNSRLRQIVHSESSVYSILHQPASCARHQHTPTHRDPATLAPPRSFHETYASTDRPSFLSERRLSAARPSQPSLRLWSARSRAPRRTPHIARTPLVLRVSCRSMRLAGRHEPMSASLEEWDRIPIAGG